MKTTAAVPSSSPPRTKSRPCTARVEVSAPPGRTGDAAGGVGGPARHRRRRYGSGGRARRGDLQADPGGQLRPPLPDRGQPAGQLLVRQPGRVHPRRQRGDLPVQPDHLGGGRVGRAAAGAAAGDEVGRCAATGAGVAGVLHPASLTDGAAGGQSGRT